MLEPLQRLSCQTDDEVREEWGLERASSCWASVPRCIAAQAADISRVHSSRSVVAAARARESLAFRTSVRIRLLNWALRKVLNPGF